jgi:hypothetical protein
MRLEHGRIGIHSDRKRTKIPHEVVYEFIGTAGIDERKPVQSALVGQSKHGGSLMVRRWGANATWGT